MQYQRRLWFPAQFCAPGPGPSPRHQGSPSPAIEIPEFLDRFPSPASSRTHVQLKCRRYVIRPPSLAVMVPTFTTTVVLVFLALIILWSNAFPDETDAAQLKSIGPALNHSASSHFLHRHSPGPIPFSLCLPSSCIRTDSVPVVKEGHVPNLSSPPRTCTIYVLQCTMHTAQLITDHRTSIQSRGRGLTVTVTVTQTCFPLLASPFTDSMPVLLLVTPVPLFATLATATALHFLLQQTMLAPARQG